jgi:hypothetical protein
VSGPLEEAHALVQSTGELERIAPVAAARAEAAWLTRCFESSPFARVVKPARLAALGSAAQDD